MNEYDDLCVCGHARRDHHLSWFAGSGDLITEECEDPDCLQLPWDEQCQHFKKVQP